MKDITNMTSGRKQLITSDDLIRSNEFSDFFLRFEDQDFSLKGSENVDSISATVNHTTAGAGSL